MTVKLPGIIKDYIDASNRHDVKSILCIISILWGTLYADAHEAPKSRSFARWVIRSANDGSAYRPEMRSWI